jgi:transcription initiation factor TFIIIB Brf1 subunit/transcription initiation factor TFIIB
MACPICNNYKDFKVNRLGYECLHCGAVLEVKIIAIPIRR